MIVPDHPSFARYQGRARVSMDATVPVSQVSEDSQVSFAQHGVNFTFDHHWVCRVSAMMITLSFAFTFCNKYVSSEDISTSLS